MTRGQIRIDTHDLTDLDLRLRAVGRVFDTRITGQTMRDAAKPMLIAVRQETPIGPTRTYKGSVFVRGKRKGKPRPTGGDYRRGGATRSDARIKIVPPTGNEQARVLVGISKSKGKVGWRTHLITRKNKHNNRANDFLRRAESRTIDVVISRFGSSAQLIIDRVLKRGIR